MRMGPFVTHYSFLIKRNVMCSFGRVKPIFEANL